VARRPRLQPALAAALMAVLATSCASATQPGLGVPTGQQSAAPRAVSADDLREAGQLVGRLQIDDGLRQRLTAEVLQAALDRVLGGEPLGSERLLGSEPDQRGLRFGLEQSYRAQARQAVDTMRRIELVDLANRVRPRTWS
jgi:Protein kinase G tetratricopeptide repeat